MTIMIKNTPLEANNVQSAADNGVLKPLNIRTGEYHYLVDFGAGISPRYHYVFNMARGMTCLCAHGDNCPATMYVQEYQTSILLKLENASDADRKTLGGELVGQMPEDYLLNFIPRYCPECGGLASNDPVWNGKYTGQKGWKCLSHGISCFLQYKSRSIAERRQQNPDPCVIPPVAEYPGVRLSELGLPGHSPYIDPGEPAPFSNAVVLRDRSGHEVELVQAVFGMPNVLPAQLEE